MDLFMPVKVGPYELPNRIVMSPMTRSRAGKGNAPTALNALYYVQRASAGLIISEASQISIQGTGYPNTPGIYTDRQIAGWRLVTDAVHEKGGKIFLQLFHCGRISHPSFQEEGGLPVAPSPVKPDGEVWTYEGPNPFVTPRALSLHEIPDIIQQFQRAAQNAIKAGFDGVEIHGANGYLLDQFLQDGTNKRSDDYGGSVENRSRLLLEVTATVCNVWGARRVGVHISPGNPFNSMEDSNPESTFSYLVDHLNQFGLAYLSVSEINLSNPSTYNASLNDLTLKLRKLYKGIYITNGGYELESANVVLSKGDADLVSFGRLFIANPDLPERFRNKSSLSQPDESKFYGGGEEGYTDYPFLEN
jgi:N-ethylmaleimide reductase